jgi:prepilin peptidase CpaA
MATITPAMILAVFILTLFSCMSDVRSLRIPNLYALAILVCFVPAWLTSPAAFGPLWYHVTAMGIMFVLTYIMFCQGMMGGGDSKLGTALGLWVGLKGLLPFVFYMALMGGVLGLLTVGLQKKKLFINPKPGSWIEQAQAGQNAVPYGIAISFGSWAAFYHTVLMHHHLNEVFKIIH